MLSIMEDLTGKKVAIISDLHLSRALQPEKFREIEKAVSECDKLIINGDLWEGFAYNFDEFLLSPWEKLFPLFIKKQAVYLFGNHDRESLINVGASKFSVEVEKKYRFSQGDQIFNVTHGDEYAPTLDMSKPKLPAFFYLLAVKVERICIQLFGKPFLYIYRRDNEKMITWKKKNIRSEEWLICGHSHLATVDKKNRFANSGIFEPPVATYLLIENGEVELRSF